MSLNLGDLKQALDVKERGGYKTETDGDTGVIETPALSGQIDSFDDILRESGFNPEEFRITGTPRKSTWDAQTPDGLQRLSSYRITVERINHDGPDIDELVQVIHQKDLRMQETAPRLTAPTVFALGDLQIGKADGDGHEGTVHRFKQAVQSGIAMYKARPTEQVLVALLGDLLEGFVSQGGKKALSTSLGVTDQLRILRHLITYAIKEWRTVCTDVHVLSAPGNHGEALRHPVDGLPHDNHDVDALRAVQEAFELAGMDGLTFHYPEGEDLSVALQLGPTRILAAHGHKWRPGKHFQWWQGQSFSGQAGHDAQYLLAGHLHHAHIEASSRRLFIQVPALESVSDWWRLQTGEVGNPGAVYFIATPDGKPPILSLL